ncbi:MAG TPA: dihydroneopterin aldolase [Gammaproteobacteria bacterium]|nr:dihydroneopterin aldolase [Gammaproteobacteria bacterium]
MPDRLFIEGLSVPARIGVEGWERRVAQPVEIDLRLQLALREAGERDELAATVDYAAVAQLIRALAAPPAEYRLVEALAERLAAAVLENFAPVAGVEIRVAKRGVLAQAQAVGCVLERQRTGPEQPGEARCAE